MSFNFDQYVDFFFNLEVKAIVIIYPGLPNIFCFVVFLGAKRSVT